MKKFEVAVLYFASVPLTEGAEYTLIYHYEQEIPYLGGVRADVWEIEAENEEEALLEGLDRALPREGEVVLNSVLI